jgi:predicted metal-dependent peptidase
LSRYRRVDPPFDCATRLSQTFRRRCHRRSRADRTAASSDVCDADVHQVQDFSGREGAKLLRGFEFKGGGGTDFRPAIAEAAAWKPDLLIYLTDLEGDAGAEPAFPVLWAVPEGKATAPWGKVVELIK